MLINFSFSVDNGHKMVAQLLGDSLEPSPALKRIDIEIFYN
jgi:hypothetical protein